MGWRRKNIEEKKRECCSQRREERENLEKMKRNGSYTLFIYSL